MKVCVPILLVVPLACGNIFVASAGVIRTVRASDFGYNHVDATHCLQSAFDSGAGCVIVDADCGDWIVRPLRLRSNQEVVLADGAVIRAKSGEFKGKWDSLLQAFGVTNVTLRGKGRAVLRMNKAEYEEPEKYEWSEWRNALSIVESSNVAVSNLSFVSSGGDGVYVRGSSDVLVEDVVCSDNHRQGMSVISADGLTVRRCRFTGTCGTAPEAGLDFEPNRPGELLRRVVLEDCTFEENRKAGLQFHFTHTDATSAPVDVLVRNCISRGNGSYGLLITEFATTCIGGRIVFSGCDFSGGEPGAVGFTSTSPDLGLVFEDCRFRAEGNAPIFRFSNNGVRADAGGMTFDGCSAWKNSGETAVFTAKVGYGLRSVRGRIAMQGGGTFDLSEFAARHAGDPAARAFPVETVPLGRIGPVCRGSGKSASAGGDGIWTRGRFSFAVCAPQAGVWTLHFSVRRHVKRDSYHMPVTVRDAAGTDLGTFHIDGLEQDYSWTSHGREIRVFDVNPQGQTKAIRVTADCVGPAFVADGDFNLWGPHRRFSFFVPKGAKSVAVELSPKDRTSARLVDPQGRAVAGKPYDASPAVLSAKGSRVISGIWSVEVPENSEHVSVRIASPALPLVSETDGDVLGCVGAGKIGR